MLACAHIAVVAPDLTPRRALLCWRSPLQVILALGIALCIVIVVFAKKALKKLTEQELQREAELAAQAEAEAAAAAAEAGTAGPGGMDGKACDSLGALDQQKRPLPLAVEGKLAEGKLASEAAPLDHKSTGSGSDGDLQVIVVDNNTTAGTAASPAGHNATVLGAPDVSRESSLIPTAQQPPAAFGAGSTTSRASSVSSMRGLLSGFFQRSS